ncbi:MAG: trp RNA-binding attenuation protein MtrB [Christensenellales bacterium]|jgi:transcription attenuation protein (tryptophan RNA-binding attenuator protein)
MSDTSTNNALQGDTVVQGDYIVVKAQEDGVNIIGMTRGASTKLHHTEKLDRGEVVIAQFTETTSAIKIRGNALILTRYGAVESGK